MNVTYLIRLALAALVAAWVTATLPGHAQTMLETGTNQPKQFLSTEQMAGQKARELKAQKEQPKAETGAASDAAAQSAP
jgi:hypothetical protein